MTLALDGSTGRLARMASVLLLLTAIGVFHVWSRTRVVAVGYALGELQREHVALTAEHDRLRIEVETLRSPASVERFARTRLGMAPPEPGAVSAAGPLVAEATAGGADGVGVGIRSGPAEPSRSKPLLVALGFRRPAPEPEPESEPGISSSGSESGAGAGGGPSRPPRGR